MFCFLLSLTYLRLLLYCLVACAFVSRRRFLNLFASFAPRSLHTLQKNNAISEDYRIQDQGPGGNPPFGKISVARRKLQKVVKSSGGFSQISIVIGFSHFPLPLGVDRIFTKICFAKVVGGRKIKRLKHRNTVQK